MKTVIVRSQNQREGVRRRKMAGRKQLELRFVGSQVELIQVEMEYAANKMLFGNCVFFPGLKESVDGLPGLLAKKKEDRKISIGRLRCR